MNYKLKDYIKYPEYDIVWINWETTTSYCLNKIKNRTNKNGKISKDWLISQLEVEWILKSEFKYPIIKAPLSN